MSRSGPMTNLRSETNYPYIQLKAQENMNFGAKTVGRMTFFRVMLGINEIKQNGTYREWYLAE
jgi:hypothetical protein